MKIDKKIYYTAKVATNKHPAAAIELAKNLNNITESGVYATVNEKFELVLSSFSDESLHRFIDIEFGGESRARFNAIYEIALMFDNTLTTDEMSSVRRLSFGSFLDVEREGVSIRISKEGFFVFCPIDLKNLADESFDLFVIDLIILGDVFSKKIGPEIKNNLQKLK
ncbi:hypothetical protein [Dickeya phage Sucellus]|nr:hypothetical protein [Dickeya phage Sucellus]